MNPETEKDQATSNRLGGRNRIHLHPNANTNWLDKNPQNINKNWPMSKSIRVVNEALTAGGHEPISRAQIEETFRLLTGLTEDSLLSLVHDKDNPILVRTVAYHLVKNWMTGIWAVNDVLDRAIWAIDGLAPVIRDSNVIVQLPQIPKK